MFLRTEIIIKSARYSLTVGHFQCDFCNALFVVEKNVSNRRKSAYHFCSIKCAGDAKKRGNASDLRRKATCQERYGAELYITQPHLAKEYARRAWEPEARETRKETLNERYGVDHPWNIPEIRERSNAVARVNITSPEMIAARNTPEAWRKRHETMKKNGTYTTSTQERIVYQMLVERFGENNVERHVRFPDIDQRHSIDFYVPLIDVYIQVDGVYWHGLNRPIEDIQKGQTKRDKNIYRKWLWDRWFDEKCKRDNIKLIRVTDIEVMSPEFNIDAMLAYSSTNGLQEPSS